MHSYSKQRWLLACHLMNKKGEDWSQSFDQFKERALLCFFSHLHVPVYVPVSQ